MNKYLIKLKIFLEVVCMVIFLISCFVFLPFLLPLSMMFPVFFADLFTHLEERAHVLKDQLKELKRTGGIK